MFCSECGTKLEEGALFCSECGHKVEEEKQEEIKKEEVKEEKKEIKQEEKKEVKPPKEKKPMSKKSKVVVVLLILICALAGGGYVVGSDLTNPKHIAKEYISAVIKNDTGKLYNYLKLEGDKTFVSKKVFKEVAPNEDYSNIENYKVTEVTKKDLTAIAKFTYTVKGEKGEKTGKVNLKKVNGKEYLIFDKWVVDEDFDDFTIENYTIKVIKGSELTYAGVKVSDKYLDKKKSDDEYDVYVLPQVFRYETTVKAKFPNGIEAESKVTPSTYYDEYVFKLNKDSITDDMKEELLSSAKKDLTTIYEKAMVSRPYDELEEKYKHNGIDLSDLEENYKELVATLERAVNELVEIEFTDVTLYDLDIDDDGNFVSKVKASFEYTVQYIMYGGETGKAKKTNSSVMSLTYKYEDGKFYLVNADDLRSYFGRY